MEYQLDLLNKGGVRDVVLCIGHLGDQIETYFTDGKKLGMNITYSREESPLGTASALKKAEHLLEDIFFTIYGDSYVFVDFNHLMSYFRSKNKLALMTVFRNRDNFDRSNTAIKDNLVSKHSKQDKTTDMEYIDYGTNLFRKEVLKMVPKDQPYSLETRS